MSFNSLLFFGSINLSGLLNATHSTQGLNCSHWSKKMINRKIISHFHVFLKKNFLPVQVIQKSQYFPPYPSSHKHRSHGHSPRLLQIGESGVFRHFSVSSIGHSQATPCQDFSHSHLEQLLTPFPEQICPYLSLGHPTWPVL